MFEGIHVGFIGGGNMGEALIKGLLAAKLFAGDRLHVFDVSPSRTAYLQNTYRIDISKNLGEIASSCQVLVLAVKPQTMAAVLAEIRSHLDHCPLIISIAAGISMSTLAASLPEKLPIVRVMPNTPALIQEGASALSKGSFVRDVQMQMALAIFKAVGKAVEVEEKWMDAVTGLSGSGPAYILMLLESLIDGGVLMGLPRPVARDLMVQTMLGTVRMVQETGKHPAELKDMITSPGGTTIHGLRVLEEQAVRGALMNAVEAATVRSEELGLTN